MDNKLEVLAYIKIDYDKFGRVHSFTMPHDGISHYYLSAIEWKNSKEKKEFIKDLNILHIKNIIKSVLIPRQSISHQIYGFTHNEWISIFNMELYNRLIPDYSKQALDPLIKRQQQLEDMIRNSQCMLDFYNKNMSKLVAELEQIKARIATFNQWTELQFPSAL